jgi:Lon protease-like protein
MVADLLDAQGRFVLATAVTDERPGAPAAVLQVAGFGEIARHEKLPDGRFLIWVLGLLRVRLAEVPSEHPYRLVQCLPFDEVDVPEHAVESLAEALRAAMASRLQGQVPAAASASLLADLLLQLSDKQISDAFRAANYDNEDVNLLTAAVKDRIAQLDRATKQQAVEAVK